MKFENSYYMTDDMTKEYVNAILCRKIRILGSAVSAASILLCIFVAVTSQTSLQGDLSIRNNEGRIS